MLRLTPSATTCVEYSHTVMTLSLIDRKLLLMLPTLDAAPAERSVARPARRLHVTPCAVSNGIERLRIALADSLAIGCGWGIVPTPCAASLGPSRERSACPGKSIQTETMVSVTTMRSFTLELADAGQIARLPAAASLLAWAMPHATHSPPRGDGGADPPRFTQEACRGWTSQLARYCIRGCARSCTKRSSNAGRDGPASRSRSSSVDSPPGRSRPRADRCNAVNNPRISV